MNCEVSAMSIDCATTVLLLLLRSPSHMSACDT